MNSSSQTWVKPTLTLISLALIAWLIPSAPIDPWNLFSPKKIVTMILALAVIQAFGTIMAQRLGTRTGSILTGFFGGLISSTATTASLAKKSKISADHDSAEILIFLSATGAMLFEGLALVIAGTADVHLSNLIVFFGPIIVTVGMIVHEYRKRKDRGNPPDNSNFQIFPILKLSLFVVAIISVSKICQSLFGQKGLVVLTSLVSLFEIHGSVIVNVQLHESGSISVKFLCSLLAISIIASYLSKLFLLATLGSAKLRNRALKCTCFVFFSLAFSWAIALSFG